MGYYVEITDSTFTIPTANLDEAYRRMVALNDDDDLKRGGTFGREAIDPAKRAALGYHPDRWFSWMDPNYPAKCADAEAIIRELGFECGMEDEGLVIYSYDNKSGQEDVFLTAIADLATGYIVWRGEEGETWKETYGESDVKVRYATMTFGEPEARTMSDLHRYVKA